MDLSQITLRMAVLFILIGIGYSTIKLRLISQSFLKDFSTLIVYIASPAMILYSVMNGERQLTNKEVFVLLLISTLSYLLVILFAQFVPKLLGFPAHQQSIAQFLFIFSNTGFMGFPVVSALWGETAVFFAAVFNIPFNILCFSYGIALASDGKIKGFSAKTILSPAVLSALVSLLIYLFRIPIPDIISVPIGYLQGMNIPGAMIILGATLATFPLKELFSNRSIISLSLIKLLIIPSIIFGILYFLPVNELSKQITTVMWMLPCATNATLLATAYDGEHQTASKGVFLTTLLSCLSLPFLCWLFFR